MTTSFRADGSSCLNCGPVSAAINGCTGRWRRQQPTPNDSQEKLCVGLGEIVEKGADQVEDQRAPDHLEVVELCRQRHEIGDFLPETGVFRRLRRPLLALGVETVEVLDGCLDHGSAKVDANDSVDGGDEAGVEDEKAVLQTGSITDRCQEQVDEGGRDVLTGMAAVQAFGVVYYRHELGL